MKKFFIVMSVLLVSAPVCAMLENCESKEVLEKRVIASACNRFQNNNSRITQVDVKNIVELTLDMDQERRDVNNRSLQEYKQEAEFKSNVIVCVCGTGVGAMVLCGMFILFCTSFGIIIFNHNKNSTSSF